jgi:hypothetical protein
LRLRGGEVPLREVPLRGCWRFETPGSGTTNHDSPSQDRPDLYSASFDAILSK